MSHYTNALRDLEAAQAMERELRCSWPEESRLAQQLVDEALEALGPAAHQHHLAQRRRESYLADKRRLGLL